MKRGGGFDFMERIDAIMNPKPDAVNPLMEQARARWHEDETLTDTEFLALMKSI